jgi:hypothetical protein
MRVLAIIAGAAILVAAGAAASADHAELLPEDPAKPAVVAVCTTCHDATEITTRRMSATQWDSIVGKMVSLGADPTDEERALITAYLPKYFGPDAPPPPGPKPPVEHPSPAAGDLPAAQSEPS